ncbi:GH92 family glycosyl hydrolase [Mycobacterium vicinigordonae]|uniref:Glycoside hydrolase family 92 protein n=1 Tax=Mycobacterium vicinigordonae TaxID=1719132 RepID=A0A7D6HVA0_9MYCO|nr:GH92 family glycosyl hydrolase [Mycobacterium vicinigordonae]QLL08272.1 glycoside hydrolase family 92 protein [Mycobacterium vicinigordonae]
MRSRRVWRVLVAMLAVPVLFVPLIAGSPTAYDGEPTTVVNPVDHVDTLIGTGTGGKVVGEINNFPGATVPFGMVQYSPDTVNNYAGYAHDNPRATGFSMTHASVGCPAFGDISMLPTTTATGSQPWYAWERIAHDRTEVGTPGYYAVRFPDTGVKAELTATTHTGIGRFSYPHDGRRALFHVRSGASLAGASRAAIQINEDNTTITGWATSGSFCDKSNTYTVYFAMKFSQPFSSYGTWDGYSVADGSRSSNSPYSGGYVEFDAGSVVEVRTAISYVGIDGAQANLAAEGERSFDDTHAAAADEWNGALKRIAVAGRNPGDVQTFYSCLYRSLLHPNTFNDHDGRYIGFDNIIHVVRQGHTHYANYSDWDTYRSLAALQALIFPERASDMAQALVDDAEQSGALPRWALANAATSQMTGDSVVPLIVSLYMFGAKDFDTRTALAYMVDAATRGGVGRNGYVERPGIETYLRLGYAPQLPEFGPGASVTLEWSIDDFTIARFADALGDAATAGEFQRRSQYWQNLFNPTTGYISPRGPSGFFRTGPGFIESHTGFGQFGYDEGNAEQYLWWVPHNVAGLATALGGRAAAAQRLDRFTQRINVGPNKPYLWAGNEPGFGVPWLYNYFGQPWQTQRTVDRVRGLFGPTPDGAPGNDDLGALSSWYVWAALGLYPSTPGTPILTIATPLFDRAEISLGAGKSIRITAPGASGVNRLRYIRSLSIDGQPTDRTYLPESIIGTGGDVSFLLSGRPDKSWGTAESSAPPSFEAGSATVTINVAQPIVAIAQGTTRTVELDLQRMLAGVVDYRVTGAAAAGGITVAPVSGRFDDDGSATVDVAITVASSVPDDNYPVYLTTTVGDTSRRAVVLLVTRPSFDE